MIKFAVAIKDRFNRVRIHTEETAQDAFEYLLVIGGVSVAVVVGIAAAPGLVTSLLAAVATAINSIPGISGVA